MPRGGATAYGSRFVCVCVRLSVCPLDFLQDGTESAAENCNRSITREYLENDIDFQFKALFSSNGITCVP